MRAVRRLLERIARGRVVERRLPTEFRRAAVYVSPDSRLAYLFRSIGAADRTLLAWVRELVVRGCAVWDIGANCGVFSIAAAVAAGARGRVLAVEPDPFLAKLVVRSASESGPDTARIEVVEAAVAEANGQVRLHLARRGRAASWIEGSTPSTQAGGERAEVEVEAVTLDSLLDRYFPPGLVKIDVEGSEARALDGAAQLLREVRPVLVAEVSRSCRVRVAEILRAARYRLYDASQSPPERSVLSEPVENTLALPE